MSTRRPIPLIKNIVFAAAVLFVAPTVCLASDIAAYAKFQKAKTNEYDHKAKDFVVVFVGFNDEDAFEVFKNIPEDPKVTVVFRKELFGAKEKSIVVGHNGLRVADITTNYVEGLDKVLNPPPPKPVQEYTYPVRTFLSETFCPPGRT